MWAESYADEESERESVIEKENLTTVG